MNYLVRYFLPSQVRGVYRFDETFGKVADEESYCQFTENKLRFLPCSLIDPIRRSANFEEDFASVSRKYSLRVLPNTPHARRANEFFARHAYFNNTLKGEQAVNGADNYLEVQFVKRILAPLLSENGLAAVQPQRRIGPYYVDFAFDGPLKLALEVDGFGKFSHRADLDEFIDRQNYIACQGWKIIRFTYGQIMNATKAAQRLLNDVLSADPHGREFLVTGLGNAAYPQSNLFDALPERDNVFDIVNGFYRVQDWFALHLTDNTSPEIVLRDDMGFPLPLAGLAISSLYHFLDAVAAVVDVRFDFPSVQVISQVMTNTWLEHLHPDVTVTRRRRIHETEVSINQLVIQNSSASLPVPLRSEEAISFRSGLSLEKIHQRLDYISREFFGYSTGTNRFQDKVLQRIFNGNETLGISTTGSGKSFCFWLPALLKPGLTIVIAPLRSLMRDQRLTLLNYGINSMEFINADVSAIEQRRFMEEAKLGYLRLLYISPERLRIKKFVEELETLQEFVPINILAIDEAHCISEWGHDFRPSYLKLPYIRMRLTEKNPDIRLLALTATAGQQVEKDICTILKLTDTDVVREPMADRECFSYQIITVSDSDSKTAAFLRVLTSDLATALRHQSLSSLLAYHNSRQEKAIGIVFCIYADPHGKNTIYDGTSHYLFETMNILEPENIFLPRRGRQIPKYNLDAYSIGRVRAFSSKPPTLCPHCNSYEYTSSGNFAGSSDADEEGNELETKPAVTGAKACVRCRQEFSSDHAQPLKPPKQWEKTIKNNQNDFKHGRFDILVATKGFGMGIDKSSVRFVIHTSLSSGIESWYQEVGRAGRDNERAHIVLLADPPNDSCRAVLENIDGPKRPKCRWTGGCCHGRKSICDYGKQHLFISKSYPGAESDAIYALGVLDRLLFLRVQTGANPPSISFNYGDEISRPELALYRLHSLGLIEDYTIVYGNTPRFEVVLNCTGLPASADELDSMKKLIQTRLDSYASQFDYVGSHQENLAKIHEEYRSLNDFAAKTKKYRLLPQSNPASIQYSFFNLVYSHLLLLLDHTYKEVVTMRYDMLWNLCNIVHSERDSLCQRVRILPYFEGLESVDETYHCGCCNVCSPELDFLDRVNPRPQNVSIEARTIEMNELLRRNILDIAKLQQLCEVFRDYRTATYAKGRAVLEGNPHNLPALYLTREFSPASELAANTKRFLRTANERRVSFTQLKELYMTSANNLKLDLILLLNEQNTVCDHPEGWEFLAEEASAYRHSENKEIAILRDCLEFMLLIEALPPDSESFLKKALSLEEMINA